MDMSSSFPRAPGAIQEATYTDAWRGWVGRRDVPPPISRLGHKLRSEGPRGQTKAMQRVSRVQTKLQTKNAPSHRTRTRLSH